MKIALINIILLCLVVGCKSPATVSKTTDAFSFLIGQWTYRNGDMLFVEIWNKSKDNEWQSHAYAIKNGHDTVHTEFIKIVERGGNYYYMPQVSNQNDNKPVEFKIVTYNNTSFVAVNDHHDFPKKITYVQKSKDYILASIDDGNEPPVKKQAYHYIRKFKP